MPILHADYSIIDYEKMAETIGLKPKHIPMLVESFLEETLLILNSLQLSINDMDYEKIESQAHAVKGSAGNLRFNEIYEMANEIEESAAKQNAGFEYQLYFDAIKSALGTISL